MTKERLENLTNEQLAVIAEKLHLNAEAPKEEPGRNHREFLMEQIVDFLQEEQGERERFLSLIARVEATKYTVIDFWDIIFKRKDRYPYLFHRSWPETKVILLVQGIDWFFTYWVFSRCDKEKIKAGDLKVSSLKLIEFEKDRPEKCSNEYYLPLNAGDQKRYINIPKMDCCYCVDLIGERGTGELTLARSPKVHTLTNYVRNYEGRDEADSLIRLSGYRAMEYL